MFRKFIALFIAMFLCMAASLAEEAAITITDMHGREIALSEPATRIVALTAADCEILCALGCEDALVGRDAYCDYPPSIADVPVVQSWDDLNIEEILMLEPQVVLMSGLFQTEEQAQIMQDNGIQAVISDADDIEGVYTSIRMLGALMGKNAEAEALIVDMQQSFDGIKEKCVDTGKTVYFEVSPLEYGLWTAGSNTFMTELAEMCGLTNAFADVEGWVQISEEQVLERNPDYIVTITMYYGEGPTPVEEIMGRSGWADVKAVANGAVFHADSDSISRPGPRLQAAAEELYGFIAEK